MIVKRIVLLLFVCLMAMSCQFTETMVLNEDGTGQMRISLDLSEIMAMSGEMGSDSTFVKKDTIVYMKDILEEKKDSISQLSKADRDRLMAMKDYKIQLQMDPDANSMLMDVFVDFKNVNEANDLMRSFEMADGLIPGSGSPMNGGDDKETTNNNEVILVNYSYENGRFTRDAFITDPPKYQAQLDSMKQAEAFMSSIKYKLKYTFPKRIKSTSAEDATFSLDGKTLELERGFLEYFKNPDVMDLEVVLED